MKVMPKLRELSPRVVDCLKVIYKMSERLATLEPSGQLSDAAVT